MVCSVAWWESSASVLGKDGRIPCYCTKYGRRFASHPENTLNTPCLNFRPGENLSSRKQICGHLVWDLHKSGTVYRNSHTYKHIHAQFTHTHRYRISMSEVHAAFEAHPWKILEAHGAKVKRKLVSGSLEKRYGSARCLASGIDMETTLVLTKRKPTI